MSAPVHFRVPASFMPVDLTIAPDELARALPAGADPALARHLKTFAEQLRARRGCYAALVALPSGKAGYFAVTEPVGAPPDLGALAARLAPSDDLREVELRCGPALAVTEYASVTDRTADGRLVEVVQEHAFLVHPTTGQVVAFTLGIGGNTRTTEHAHLFAEILETVSFPR